MAQQKSNLSTRDNFMAQKQLSYDEKKVIANQYLMRSAGTTWDDLADTNSLHDCQTRMDIFEACEERLSNDMNE